MFDSKDAEQRLGHAFRALGAIKSYWDANRDSGDWKAILDEWAHPGRIEALLTATLILAQRAGLSGPELIELGNEHLQRAAR